MLIRALLLVAVLGATCAGADDATPNRPNLKVLKHGDSVFIRTAFAPEQDLLVRLGKGTNRQINYSSAFLLPAAADMSLPALSNARLIHGNGDDATPWNLNGTYIGANHGCSDVRELTSAGHGKTAADLGSRWEDSAGTSFYLIKVVDATRLWFLSANQGKGDIWKFRTSIAGTSLKPAATGAPLSFTDNKMAQLTPACRIKTQQFLVDGTTELADDQPVTCSSFDVVEEYDVINPASLLQDIIDHPGVERSFVADHLAGVVSNRIIYRFEPGGANVIYYTARALQDFDIGYMGFIQSARLTRGDFATHRYYIPKTVPFTQDGIALDFRAGQDYTTPPRSPLIFSAAKQNVADPANLPERFIQLLGRTAGDQTVEEVGYALGYSLIYGLTQPAERAKNANQALMLYVSAKSYPTAVDAKRGRPIPAGTQFECVAYRQYFRPAAHQNATCLYWHRENTDTVVYADYHQSVERDTLVLPPELTGKSLTIVEKTPSLTVHTTGAVPAGGVVVSVSDGYGYVVLRVR